MMMIERPPMHHRINPAKHIRIHRKRQSRLPEIVEAARTPRPLPRLIQRRQQHPRQYRNNRNHHEELYERKSRFSRYRVVGGRGRVLCFFRRYVAVGGRGRVRRPPTPPASGKVPRWGALQDRGRQGACPPPPAPPASGKVPVPCTGRSRTRLRSAGTRSKSRKNANGSFRFSAERPIRVFAPLRRLPSGEFVAGR